MARKRFPISSEQLELLLAFESCGTFQKLSAAMTKDPSVVSRNLQQLAEVSPVIVKVNGRWQISPLGQRVNEQTIAYLSALDTLVRGMSDKRESSIEKLIYEKTALIIINAQNGLLNPKFGNRCNEDAEENIAKLLKKWRDGRYPVIHVRHASTSPESAFYVKSTGFDFISNIGPREGELIVEKSKSSAFTETPLLEELTTREIDTVVVTGFTANECIDATARQSSELGFATYVVGDASASFDISGHDGKLFRAERVHKLTLANLHALYAKVVTTDYLLK